MIRLFSEDKEQSESLNKTRKNNSEDNKPKVESTLPSKSKQYHLPYDLIQIIDESKASFDFLKVSECLSVDVSDAPNKNQDENNEKHEIVTKQPNKSSTFKTEHKSALIEGKEDKSDHMATQDALDRISNALKKSQPKENAQNPEKREILKEIQNNPEINALNKSEQLNTQKKKNLNESLPNLTGQRKQMQSNFKERFAQLKNSYKAELKVDDIPITNNTANNRSMSNSRLSSKKKSEIDAAKHTQDKDAQAAKDATIENFDEIIEESVEVNSNNEVEQREYKEEVKQKIEQKQPQSQSKALDRYDNLSNFIAIMQKLKFE